MISRTDDRDAPGFIALKNRYLDSTRDHEEDAIGQVPLPIDDVIGFIPLGHETCKQVFMGTFAKAQNTQVYVIGREALTPNARVLR